MTIFIPWSGGEQPVPDLSHVHVRFRNREHANDTDAFYAQELDWFHDPEDPEYDIVEYAPAAIQPIFNVHGGGETPFPDTPVEIVMRGSSWVITGNSNDFDWSHSPVDPDSDITLYRVV